jgi:hypothetical protein
MRLKEQFYSLLQTDAQSAAAGSLGVLLGYNAVTKPQNVFYQNPPKSPDLPLLIYAINTQVGYFPRDIFITVTGYDADNLNLNKILERVWDLLQKNEIEFVNLDDFQIKQILFDWSSAEVYDAALKCYQVQYRFRFISVRI